MTEEEDEGTGNCASELRSAESQRSARALKSHSFTFVATHSNSPPIRTRTNCSHRTNFLRTPTFRTRQLSLSLSATAMSDEQFNVQGYNIVTILKRLEAATSRLEDITIFQDEVTRSNDDVASLSLSKSKAISSKDIPGNSTNSVPSAPPAPPAQPTPEDPKFVTAFGDFITSSVNPFVDQSKQIDPIVGDAATLFAHAFDEQVHFLRVVAQAKKPDMADAGFLALLKPINEAIEQINQLKDTNRGTKTANHLATISEGASVLGWIVSDTPVLLIPEFKDSAQFWANRVVKEYKTEPQHQEWTRSFLGIFDDLKAYVKEYHPTGPSWSPSGKLLLEVVSQSPKKSAPSSQSGSVPAPPPPPPADIFSESSKSSDSSSSGGMKAVFADRNQGENVTSSLKKVDKLQMTHKNPELRLRDPASAPKKPLPPKKPSNLSGNSKKKPAKKELVDGSKWIIENFSEQDISEPIVIETDMTQLVFIGNCQGITVQIKGKANAVSISETKSTGVAVDSLISGLDVIKSSKFGVQVTGVVPMISIDLCDEGSVYLSQESIDADAQVYTSSTTTMNIYVPKDGDFVELAVPEQFKHSVKNGSLTSEVVEHAG